MSKKDPVKGRTGLVKRGAAGGGSGNGPGGAKRGAGTESTGLSGAGRVNRRRRGKEAVVGGFKGCREEENLLIYYLMIRKIQRGEVYGREIDYKTRQELKKVKFSKGQRDSLDRLLNVMKFYEIR